MTTLNQTRPGGPYRPNQTFRTIDDEMIYWSQTENIGLGISHICEGADVHRGIRVLWTLCDKDVPANKAWQMLPSTAYNLNMCPVCVAKWQADEKVTV